MPFAPSAGEWSFKDFMGFFLLSSPLVLGKKLIIIIIIIISITITTTTTIIIKVNYN